MLRLSGLFMVFHDETRDVLRLPATRFFQLREATRQSGTADTDYR
jgi:hypothetical protein